MYACGGVGVSDGMCVCVCVRVCECACVFVCMCVVYMNTTQQTQDT